MMNEVCAKLATSIFNLDSARVPHPSLHERKKGFTEVWGVEDDSVQIKSQTQTTSDKEQQNVPLLILTQHRVAYLEQLYLRMYNIPHIVQNSPYICTESTGPLPYLTDLKGDGANANHSTSKMKKEAPPALVGRIHPKHNLHLTTSSINDNGNDQDFISSNIQSNCNPIHFSDASDIITYLRMTHPSIIQEEMKYSQEKTTTTKEGAHLIPLYESLLLDTLQPILEYLRHNGNPGNTTADSLYQISLQAGCNSGNGSNDKDVDVKYGLFHPLATFQYWSTKIISKRNNQWWYQKNQNTFSNRGGSISHKTESGIFINGQNWSSGKVQDLTKLLTMAKQGYISLDKAIAKSSSLSLNSSLSSMEYKKQHEISGLLGSTTTPAYIDVLLFAHLCEALLDPELLLILSACPNLLHFFKDVYERYFGDGYTGTSEESNNSKSDVGATTATVVLTEEWFKHNNRINQSNAYHPKWMFSTHYKDSNPLILDMAKEMAFYLCPPSANDDNNDYDDEEHDDEYNYGEDEEGKTQNRSKRIKPMEDYIWRYPTRHFYPHPANVFHRVRLGGPLYPNDTNNNKSKEGGERKENDDNHEQFGGFFSSQYLKSNERWYAKYVQKYSNQNSENDPNMSGGASGTGGSEGEHWMKLQKKIALENDRKWMGFIAGVVGAVFIVTSTAQKSSPSR